ncbi:MAG TPA: DNA topoisomerase IV subunit B, partial [Rhodocyclaceae bacterium]|nr:DNA topoisomerase IV subunit B [Rhodocyclaceae bacterium]
KGLGEMNPDQLWETTLCPGTRRLVEFQMSRHDMARMADTFHLLMGKGEASGRRAWMEREGNSVEADL